MSSTALIDSDAPAPTPPSADTGQMARTAGLISLGNVASRILGLAVITVKASFFGASGTVDAFNVASAIPTLLYDLLIGGMINSSLVPIFMEYVHDRRNELWNLVSIVLSLTTVVLSGVVIIAELFAPQIVSLFSSGSRPEVQELAARLFRIMAPVILLISISGVMTALLFALKRFTYPAFTGAVLNAGVLIATVALHGIPGVGITSMAIGMMLGGLFQVLLQFPGLRDARLQFRLDVSHPALRHLLFLYAPNALVLLVDTLISRPISYNLASHTGEGSIAIMGYATSLREMPQGLVAVAISFAALPLLAANATSERATGDQLPFRATLARGLRLVLVLIVPATVGLFVLAQPVVQLAYERGPFLAQTTGLVTRALQLYLIGLPFAAIDLTLIFSFYARQDTLTPSIIGIVTIVIYLIQSILLLPVLGVFSLILADSCKQILHASISAVILSRRIGGVARQGLWRTLALVLVAAGVMGGATLASLSVLSSVVGSEGLLSRTLLVVVPILVGGAAYLGLVTLMRLEEVNLLWSALRRRLGMA